MSNYSVIYSYFQIKLNSYQSQYTTQKPLQHHDVTVLEKRSYANEYKRSTDHSHEKKNKFEKTILILEDIITKLQSIGLEVVAVVPDIGSNF